MIPYDKRTGKIWYNDNLVDWGDVKLHVLSHGLHYASCIFEGERVYDGAIFKLEEHTERFFYSAKRMGFKIPYTQDQINEASKNYIHSKSKQWLCKTSSLERQRNDGNICSTNPRSTLLLQHGSGDLILIQN